ncbi:phage protease [Marivivens aquimaris]|uniref:phage protease n=1 Tax=Marivivens aquimaris TaxID=2774876 RepID=UPI00187E1E92|nr:phage protease [Marivivens aquimaris]
MNKPFTHTALSLHASLDVTEGSAPEWVHLLPATDGGRVETNDQRGPYHVATASEIIAASFARTDRLPIDENHATDLAAPKGGPAPARGWIVEMEARDDGIWGRVDWTATGRELVTTHAYRGISPVITHDPKHKIGAILRASLVNVPNLRGLTALHQQEMNDMSFMAKLAEALGLDPEVVTEDEILAAIGKTAAPVEDTALQSQLATKDQNITALQSQLATKDQDITALQAECSDLTKQLNSERASRRTAAAEAFVDGEIAKGRVGVKPMRATYIAMHSEDASRTEALIAAMPVLEPGAIADLSKAKDDDKVALNAEQREAAKLLGISEDAYAETLKSEQ